MGWVYDSLTVRFCRKHQIGRCSDGRHAEDAPSRVATAVIDAAELPNRIGPDPLLSSFCEFVLSCQPFGGQRRAGMPLPQRMAAATAAAAAAKTLAKPVSKEALSKKSSAPVLIECTSLM